MYRECELVNSIQSLMECVPVRISMPWVAALPEVDLERLEAVTRAAELKRQHEDVARSAQVPRRGASRGVSTGRALQRRRLE